MGLCNWWKNRKLKKEQLKAQLEARTNEFKQAEKVVTAFRLQHPDVFEKESRLEEIRNKARNEVFRAQNRLDPLSGICGA
jgi:hypothetical protein